MFNSLLEKNLYSHSNFIFLLSAHVSFRSLPPLAATFALSLILVILLAEESIDTYGINHWKIFRSGYRKFAWLGFEPTTTEFRWDSLTDWLIKPWVQIALRDNIIQLLQYYLFVEWSRFISVFAFVRRHICSKPIVTVIITLVAEWIDTYSIHH